MLTTGALLQPRSRAQHLKQVGYHSDLLLSKDHRCIRSFDFQDAPGQYIAGIDGGARTRFCERLNDIQIMSPSYEADSKNGTNDMVGRLVNTILRSSPELEVKLTVKYRKAVGSSDYWLQ